MALLDKLKQRVVTPQGITSQALDVAGVPKPSQVTQPLVDRISQAPQAAVIAKPTAPQQDFDGFPMDQMLQGINTILAGKNSGNLELDNFVKQSTAQGKTPDQIIQDLKGGI